MRMELALIARVQVHFRGVQYAEIRVGRDAIVVVDPAMMEKEIPVVKFVFQKEPFHVVAAREQGQIMLVSVFAVMGVVKQPLKSVIIVKVENLLLKFRSLVCVFYVKERVG